MAEFFYEVRLVVRHQEDNPDMPTMNIGSLANTLTEFIPSVCEGSDVSVHIWTARQIDKPW